MQFIDPRSDYAFKRIFGNDKVHDILISFLNAVTGLDGVCFKAVADTMQTHDENTEIGFLSKADLSRGFTVSCVAERHGFLKLMVWSPYNIFRCFRRVGRSGCPPDIGRGDS